MSILYRFLVRGGTAAALTSVNEVPKNRELVYETDTGLYKLGNGVTAWNSLNYEISGALADPGADRLLFWDDSAGKWEHLTLGAGLAIVGTTISSSGGGSIALIGTATVSGAAATTLTLSGLDFNLYKQFYIVFTLKNATASLSSVSAFYNSDTTAVNYYRQSLRVSNTSVTSARANNALVLEIPISSYCSGRAFIEDDINGMPRSTWFGQQAAPASLERLDLMHVWNSATNVTSITLSASVASSLDIGSTFSLYGVT